MSSRNPLRRRRRIRRPGTISMYCRRRGRPLLVVLVCDWHSTVTFRRTALVGLAGLATALLLTALAGPPVLRVGHFSAQASSDSIPDGWTEIRFGENESGTDYNLVRRDSTVVVQARSTNGSSGLVRHPRVDLAEHPILEWRWRVDKVPSGADIATDTTDDAAARLYVTFDYDDLGLIDRIKLALLRRFGYDKAPSRALNYLWSSHRAPGTVIESPYTDQIMMMPVRTGTARVGEWVTERRNVRADYREAYGEAPPLVNGIALMTDTDNTGGTARALYGDIVFRARSSKSAGREDRSTER